MTRPMGADELYEELIELLPDLGFVAADDPDEYSDLPKWIADRGYVAVMDLGPQLLAVNDDESDAELTLFVMTRNGVMLHKPLHLDRDALGLRLFSAMVRALADGNVLP